MSKADCIAAKAPAYIGMPYKLGEEGKYVAGPEQTNAIDIDCSGLAWALWLDCGVKLNGRKPDRLTADAYWHMATPISTPEIPGDCCWFPKTGHKTHIAIYIGNGNTIEAGNHGPNNTYPGHGYVGTCTVAEMNKRGAVWGRLAGLDIYEEDDMTPDEVRAIVREEIEQVWDDKAGDEAEAHLLKAGILTKKHPGSKAASIRYLNITLSRLAKKAGIA